MSPKPYRRLMDTLCRIGPKVCEAARIAVPPLNKPKRTMKIGLRNSCVRTQALTRETTSVPLKADLGKPLKSIIRCLTMLKRLCLNMV
jgi:hypothetical protein